MPLTILHGDLLACGEPVLVCPTNGVGVMGAGLAKAFAHRFPGLESLHLSACRRREHDAGHPIVWHGPWSSGSDAMYGPGGGRWPVVVCVATKRRWQEPSRLADVADGAAALKRLCAANGWRRIAVPALGCGLGGLSLDAVLPILKATFADDAVHAVLVLPLSAPTPLE